MRVHFASEQRRFWAQGTARLAVWLSGLLLLLIAACIRSNGPTPNEAGFARCRTELTAIPGVEAVLRKPREEEEARGEVNEGLPFEGLQVALTINGAIRSTGGGEEDEDDWCPAGGEQSLDKLIAAVKETGVSSTVCFVAGKFLNVGLHEKWLQAGNQLGSLPYTRMRAVHNTAGDFISDIDRNEEVLAPLWRRFPGKTKYFRYPRNKISRDTEVRAGVREHLRSKGYAEAPATIDPRDWRFSQIYCAALARGDNACAEFVKQCFFSYLRDTTQKARAIALELTGRPSKHTLMVEATQFTADNLAEVVAWYKRLGAKFVSLDDALDDPLYEDRGSELDAIALTVARRVKKMRSRDDDD